MIKQITLVYSLQKQLIPMIPYLAWMVLHFFPWDFVFSCFIPIMQFRHKNHIKFFSSETIFPSVMKLDWDDLLVVHMTNCSWQPSIEFKMVAITLSFNLPLLLHLKSKWTQIYTAAEWQWIVLPNWAWMVFRWSTFKIVCDDPTLHAIWLPQLKQKFHKLSFTVLF